METRSRKRARLIIRNSNELGEDTAGPRSGGARDSRVSLQVFKMETRTMKGASISKKEGDKSRLEEDGVGMEEEEAPNPSACVFAELLEQVFSYLSPQELKVSRQVSKSWNVEACRALRRRSFVLFDKEKVQSLPSIVEVIETGRVLELPTPFEDISGQLISSKSYTILRDLTAKDLLPILRITSLEPRAVLRRRLPVVHRALIKWAPHLRNLDFYADFYAVRFPSIPLMEHLSFPKLKSLSFMIDDSTNQDSVDFIVSAISGSPQLVELKFRYFHFRVGPTTLSQIYTRANLKNIEELSVIDFNYMSFVLVLDDLLLIQNHSSLKTLVLETLPGFWQEYSSLRLVRVLTKFADTLQNLSWHFNVEWDVLGSSFPFLGKLTKLEVRDFTFRNQFWSRVPALKKFKCRRVLFFVENHLNAGQRVEHLSLEEFMFQRYINVDADIGDQIIHDTFPGMTSLIRLGPQNPG